MAVNNLSVDAIAGIRGTNTNSLIAQIQNAGPGNTLKIIQQQIEKIKNAETLTDTQRTQKERLTAEKEDVEKKSGLLSTLDEQLAKLGSLANQLNGLGGLRAEEIKKVKGQKDVVANPLDVTKANLTEDKLTLGNADVLFGSHAVDAQVQVQVQVAAGATNIEGLPSGTVTARRVGNSDHIQLLDANGQVINLGGSSNGSLNSVTGVSVGIVTTQETEEQKRAANLKKIRETFSAFTEQINTVKTFLAENTKEGGALANDSGARQLNAALNQATQPLTGVDTDKFVQGTQNSFVQFERIGRVVAQNVSGVANRFGGTGSVLGQEVSGLKSQSANINNQLEDLAKTEEGNRQGLIEALNSITSAVQNIGLQSKFLGGVGKGSTDSNRTTPKAPITGSQQIRNRANSLGIGNTAASVA